MDCVCVYYCRTYYKAVLGGGRRRVDDMCYDRRRAKACVIGTKSRLLKLKTQRFGLDHKSRKLNCLLCYLYLPTRSNTASASAATTSHPWRPSPVPQGRSFHRTVDRNDPGAPAATHQGRRCVSASPVAPCSGGPHSVWPGYMCCSACTAESTAQGSTVHLKRIPEGPCAKGRRRHGAH